MFKKILALVVMLSATLALAAVDVNKANDTQLDAIKGIGPSTSRMILDERKKGEFKSWENLIERVKGVGAARAAKLSAEGLTVSGAPYKGAAAPAAAKGKEAKADKKMAKAETAKPEGGAGKK